MPFLHWGEVRGGGVEAGESEVDSGQSRSRIFLPFKPQSFPHLRILYFSHVCVRPPCLVSPLLDVVVLQHELPGGPKHQRVHKVLRWRATGVDQEKIQIPGIDKNLGAFCKSYLQSRASTAQHNHPTPHQYRHPPAGILPILVEYRKAVLG